MKDNQPIGPDAERIAHVLNNLAIASSQIACLWQRDENPECPHCRIISIMDVVAKIGSALSTAQAENARLRGVLEDAAWEAEQAWRLLNEELTEEMKEEMGYYRKDAKDIPSTRILGIKLDIEAALSPSHP